MRILCLICATVLALGVCAAANAQSVADLMGRGKIRIGVNTGVPPFDSIDSRGNLIGYDIDVSNLIGKYLGVSVDLVPLASAARIPALEAGKVDILVSTLAPTPERARTVAFTMPYCVFRLAVFARKDAALKTVDDLKDHSVGFNRGTSQESFVAQLTAQGTKVLRFDDVALTGQALLSGQIDAAAIPETAGQELLRSRPQAGLEEKFVFYTQPNSIAVRHDALELRQWLNNVIYFIKQNGELDAISRKWVGTPLPKLPVF